jgi:hypothetical protein
LSSVAKRKEKKLRTQEESLEYLCIKYTGNTSCLGLVDNEYLSIEVPVYLGNNPLLAIGISTFYEK